MGTILDHPKKLFQLAPLIFAPAHFPRPAVNTRSIFCANRPTLDLILGMRVSIAHAWAKQPIALSGSRKSSGATPQPFLKIDRTPVTPVYIESLNETIDLHEKRVAALENRVPPSVWF